MKKFAAAAMVACMGAMFLAVGIVFLLRDSDFREKGVKADAVIVRIDSDYDRHREKYEHEVYVEYAVWQTVYTERLGYYSSGMDVGEVVPILYMPGAPGEIVYAGTGSIVLPSVFCAAGGILAGVGAFVALRGTGKRVRLKRLKEEGRQVSAVVKRIEYNAAVYVFGKHPAVLVCADQEGREYSAKIMHGRLSVLQPGDPIAVYIDRADPEKYAVDADGAVAAKTGE